MSYPMLTYVDTVLGRQHLGSYINLTAYYAIAMPISIVAAFVFHWELLGLWFGVTLALVLIAFLESYIILTTDWDQVSAPSAVFAILLTFDSGCERSKGEDHC
jgi:Na+-driven multidrug efflux pump